MTEAYPMPLRGIVEADETFVGGKLRKGKYKSKKEAALHRMDNKTIVVGAIERGGRLRVRTAEDTTADTIEGFIEDSVSDDATAIYSDANPSYRQTGTRTRTHAYVDHTAEEWVRGDVHTNTIESAWSLFDRAVIGSYHKLSRKHMDAYLAEFEFRFNNRNNPYLFRDTLLKLLSAEPRPYAELTAGEHP